MIQIGLSKGICEVSLRYYQEYQLSVDYSKAMKAERNFQNTIIQPVLITKTVVFVKLENLAKNSLNCAINSDRCGR